eukprot:TRINITY_DN2123_c0_g2_i6.p1 TRINITY_DN2123_c0_g2~~TRINITY_DN2123_c0_g2_i6.p1  ORF type:complete len:232 (-),score=26.65 TRINITY_DN2123_c0_g2_i6:288-983(-)
MKFKRLLKLIPVVVMVAVVRAEGKGNLWWQERTSSYIFFIKDTSPLLMWFVVSFIFRSHILKKMSPTTKYHNEEVGQHKIRTYGRDGMSSSLQNLPFFSSRYKLRINPVTLVVHTGDFSFTKSTGLCCHTSHKPTGMTHIPYATARGCNAPLEQDGRANIDLRQTPFAVADNFQFGGCLAAGDWEKRDNDQVVAMTGGGYCGWACPKSVTYDDNFRPLDLGGWHLQLKLVN